MQAVVAGINSIVANKMSLRRPRRMRQQQHLVAASVILQRVRQRASRTAFVVGQYRIQAKGVTKLTLRKAYIAGRNKTIANADLTMTVHVFSIQRSQRKQTMFENMNCFSDIFLTNCMGINSQLLGAYPILYFIWSEFVIL